MLDLGKELTKVELQIDLTPLTFGKYKDWTPEEIAEEDPEYLCWAYTTFTPVICSHALYIAAKGELKSRRR